MKKTIFVMLLTTVLYSIGLSASADYYYNNEEPTTQETQTTQPSVYGFAPPPKPMHAPVTNYTNNSYANINSYKNYSNQTNTTNTTNTINTVNTQNTTNTNPYERVYYYSTPTNYTQSNPSYTAKPQIVSAKPAKRERETINTPNYTNSNVSFFYYIPSNKVDSSSPFPVIIWVPGLDGNGEESIPEQFYKLADTYGYGILSPTFVFNENDFNESKSYQYPQAWSGQALIDMLEMAKGNGLNYSKLYMAGFSAGAQFSSRFSLMKPEMVAACALLSSGARVRPNKNNGVRYFIGIGNQDDEYRLKNAEIFSNAAQNLSIPIIYKKYNMDHTTSDEEFNDVVDFFERVRTGTM